MADTDAERKEQTMNQYEELHQKQRQEVNSLPLGFAFSDQQFNDMMRGWGLDPEQDLDRIYRLGSTGGFFKKTDMQLIHSTFRRHKEERETAIAEDKTGEGYIYQMFLYEMENHEYSYTGDSEETLEALGYTWKEVMADKRLAHGLEMAQKKILERE